MALRKYFDDHSLDLEETTMSGIWGKAKAAVSAVWGRTSRRLRLTGALFIFLYGISPKISGLW